MMSAAAQPRSDGWPDAAAEPLGKTFELSTHLIAREVLRRGYSVEWVNFTSFLTVLGGQEAGFWVTRCPLSNTFAERACTRKDVTAKLLRRGGLSVAEGKAFKRDEFDEAAAWARDLGVSVVKPVNGMKGRGLTVGVEDAAQFRAAWSDALKVPRVPAIMVERMHSGPEARFVVVGGRCVAVGGKRPPYVVGDGRSTIRELVRAKNRQRRRSPHLRSRLIRMGEGRVARLQRLGLGLDSVLDDGRELQLDTSGNISTGAESVDLTDEVHPSYLPIAEKAVAAMLGLGVGGVDIMSRDFSQPADLSRYIVIEVNSHPGIGAHHFPLVGQPRDVAAAIVDHVIRELETGGDNSPSGSSGPRRRSR